MDALERGETFVITRNGVAVGELRPVTRFAGVPTAEAQRMFAGLPRVDYAQMRREADEFFGSEDRIDDE